MNITLEEESLGKIIIKPVQELEPTQKFAIKSLAFLMLACMNEKPGETFNKVLEILKTSVDKIKKIYNGGLDGLSDAAEFSDDFSAFH